jgi:hypothetical protein
VVERVVEAGEEVGVVRLQQALGVGAEADEARAHPPRPGAQALHVDGAGRDAGRHELREERVHLGGRAQRRQLGDGGGESKRKWLEGNSYKLKPPAPPGHPLPVVALFGRITK